MGAEKVLKNLGNLSNKRNKSRRIFYKKIQIFTQKMGEEN